MYKIQKKILIWLLLLGMTTSCGACHNGKSTKEDHVVRQAVNPNKKNRSQPPQASPRPEQPLQPSEKEDTANLPKDTDTAADEPTPSDETPEEHLQTVAKRADRELQQLLQIPELPPAVKEKIAQALENKKQRQQEPTSSLTYAYAEITSLIEKTDFLQIIALSKNCKKLVNMLKENLDVLILLERELQKTKQLEAERDQARTARIQAQAQVAEKERKIEALKKQEKENQHTLLPEEKVTEAEESDEEVVAIIKELSEKMKENEQQIK